MHHGGVGEPGKPRTSPSGTWRGQVTLALLALWALAAWGGARLYFERRLAGVVARGTARAELHADGLAEEIARTLRSYAGLPALLADRRNLVGAVTAPVAARRAASGRRPALSAVDAYLLRAGQQLGADVVWLVDADGWCVAASNADRPESFVGTRFADREYFLEARAGQPGRQYAVGRKTGIPGLYFSEPISSGGVFAGALVVKANIEKLSFWVETDAFVTDRNGVVILARDPDLVMRALPGAPFGRLPAGERLERYARVDLRPLSVEPWDDARFPALRRLEGRAEPVALISRELPQEELAVTVLAAFPEIAASDREHLALFLILAVGGGTLIVAASGRLAYARRQGEAREALRVSEERFRLAFKGSPDAIAINRVSDGLYLEVNDGFLRLTGYTMDEVVGHSSIELDVWQDLAARGRLVEQVVREGSGEVETRFRRKDRSLLWGAMSAKLLRIGGVQCMLSVTRDVTELKRAQEERQALEDQLRQAQRLESIGRLAGGVAHDFNNLLTVILGSAETLKEERAAGTPLSPEAIDEIASAGQRAGELTRQLLAFARRQVIAPVPLDLNAIVRRSEKLLRRLLGEDVELVTALEPRLWTVRCDPGQIEQAIVNLAVNSRDAMPGGGRLTIESRNVEVDDALVAAHPFMRRGPHALLVVRDSGEGMTPEARAHVFEPFFTTKPRGKGTGLGLATVYGIVKQNAGFVLLESEAGRGTTFELYFPRTLDASVEVFAPTPAPGTGTETVLLVEDDAQVREVALRSLRSAGYRVLVAGSGAEALDVSARHGDGIDLLLTDVIMPGLNGRELAEALRRDRPALRVLYMSGYTHEVISRAGVLDSGIEFLPKPFTAAALQQRVRRVLDAR